MAVGIGIFKSLPRAASASSVACIGTSASFPALSKSFRLTLKLLAYLVEQRDEGTGFELMLPWIEPDQLDFSFINQSFEFEFVSSNHLSLSGTARLLESLAGAISNSPPT